MGQKGRIDRDGVRRRRRLLIFQGATPVIASIDNLPSPESIINEYDILIIIGHEDGLRQLGKHSGS